MLEYRSSVGDIGYYSRLFYAFTYFLQEISCDFRYILLSVFIEVMYGQDCHQC